MRLEEHTTVLTSGVNVSSTGGIEVTIMVGDNNADNFVDPHFT